MIRSGEEKAVITGLFVLSEQKALIESLCEKYGLPFEDDQLIISRELTHKGRNVVRINGQLTTINVLREIGRNLVDIHGQNDQQISSNFTRSEEHTSELQSRFDLVCRLLLE